MLVHDPVACPEETRHEYGIELIVMDAVEPVDEAVLAVAHKSFVDITAERLAELCYKGSGCGVVVDVKGVLKKADDIGKGMVYWSL